jgi:hypothetical protein
VLSKFMSAAQVASAIRLLIVFFGGVLVSKGYLSQEQVDFINDPEKLLAVVGGAAAIYAAIYGVWIRRPAGIVKDATNLPDVGRIEVSPSIARSVAKSSTAAVKVKPVDPDELRRMDEMTRN